MIISQDVAEALAKYVEQVRGAIKLYPQQKIGDLFCCGCMGAQGHPSGKCLCKRRDDGVDAFMADFERSCRDG